MAQLLLPIIYLAFISLGLPDSLLGSAWPNLYPALGVPVSCAGILSMIISAGTILSSLCSDRLTRALGTGKVTALSVALTAAALFGFSVSSAFWMLCLWAVPWQREVLTCLREAWQEVADEPFDYENRVRYHLSAALRLLSTQCVGGRTKVSQQEQIAAERMKQMLRFVEEHYAEELTVERIAACVALSESACLRSFRQLLGITPIQYVKQFRVEKAAELLRSTRLKTGEIGLECGFSDGSYFIKTFREIKHCTPREYRTKFC